MNRKANAEKLYDAIGLIKDEYVSECQNYTQKSRFGATQKALSALAACALIMICISTAVRLIPKNESPDSTQLSILQVLNSAQIDPIEKESIDVFGNEKLLVWYTDGQYRSVTLSENEFAELVRLASTGYTEVFENEDTEHRMWLCDGNGGVKSPYLYDKAGNVSSRLFSYRSEIIPSEEFTKAVSEIFKT